MDVAAIGKYLSELRKKAKLTQTDISTRLGVTRQAVSRWETGCSLPDIDTFIKISELYGITVNDIINTERTALASFNRITLTSAEKFTSISVIGCGRWGTFIAWYLDKIGHRVTLYGRKSSKNMQELLQNRKNEYVVLRDSTTLTTEFKDVIKNDIIIISIDSQSLSSVAEQLKKYNIQEKTIVLCMKGLEISTGRRLSQVIDDCVDKSNSTAVWIGPGHVEAFTKGIPNCMVIDSTNEVTKQKLINMFSSELIRFYYGTDLIGNEIGAATKNVIGIAAGMLDGLNLTTLKGALMARGTNEISKLITALGGNGNSVYGLCHLGDYEATVFSKYSHNRRFGECVVTEQSYDRLAEGYYTVKAVINIAKNLGIDMPICSAVYEILYNNKKPKTILKMLFSRNIKDEF